MLWWSRKKSPKWSLRAKRSNLVFCKCLISWDCFVATLLAMTRGWTFYEFINCSVNKKSGFWFHLPTYYLLCDSSWQGRHPRTMKIVNPPSPPFRDCVVTPNCLCERPKGAWQSLYFQCIMRLLRSLHSLAMTLRHSLLAKGGWGDLNLIIFYVRRRGIKIGHGIEKWSIFYQFIKFWYEKNLVK
jgi:hypothetical protein